MKMFFCCVHAQSPSLFDTSDAIMDSSGIIGTRKRKLANSVKSLPKPDPAAMDRGESRCPSRLHLSSCGSPPSPHNKTSPLTVTFRNSRG